MPRDPLEDRGYARQSGHEKVVGVSRLGVRRPFASQGRRNLNRRSILWRRPRSRHHLPVSGGTFYAANGYHHHFATNIWNRRGAPARSYPSTGLAAFEVCLDTARTMAIARRSKRTDLETVRFDLCDPWGSRKDIVTKQPDSHTPELQACS